MTGKPRCKATSKQTGQPCQRYPIPGGDKCKHHGGHNPAVKAKAAVRHELSLWGLDHLEHVDPGETLLRLLTQAVHRAERYAAEIEAMVAEHGLQEALIGDTLVIDPASGSQVKVNEYIRGMAQLESTERDRAARFAKLALDAGIAERAVRIAERQGAMIEQVLMAAFDQLGLTPAQRAEAPAAIRAALQVVS